MKGANANYLMSIWEGIKSSLAGLIITFRHLHQAIRIKKQVPVQSDNYFSQKTGIVTLQYPHESLSIPDNGRYRLHNEMDDCIVCDLCAKICPVNCIEIEPVKAIEEIGKTSDGTTKRIYAAKFDIDLAKCCYCGLCTTVCPTECLTMTKTFDYTEFDVKDMIYHFTNLNPEEAQAKKIEWDQFQALKNEKKDQVKSQNEYPAGSTPKEKTTSLKPVIKNPVAGSKIETEQLKKDTTENPEKKRNENLTFKPVIQKPSLKTGKEEPSDIDKSLNKDLNSSISSSNNDPIDLEGSKNPIVPEGNKKPVFKPVIKAPAKKADEKNSDTKESDKEKSNLTPAIEVNKDVPKETMEKNQKVAEEEKSMDKIPKPLFKPIIKVPSKKGDIKEDTLSKEEKGDKNISQSTNKISEDQDEKSKKGNPMDPGEKKKYPKPIIKPIIPKKPDDENKG